MTSPLDLPITRHASIRMRQRGIPPLALECLLDFGRTLHDHRGAELILFDKQARRACQRRLDASIYRELERHFGVYAVRGTDGALVTVGHRRGHLSRP